MLPFVVAAWISTVSAPEAGAVTMEAAASGLTLTAGGRALTRDALPYLAWRRSGESAWRETVAQKLESARRDSEAVSFEARFEDLRADVRVARVKPSCWRITGTLTNAGSQTVELARFHYLDGALGTPGAYLDVVGDSGPALHRAGEHITATRARLDRMFESWHASMPSLADPIHDAPDWALATDLAVFTDGWNAPGWLVGFTGPGTAFGQVGFRTRPAPCRFFAGVLLDNVTLDPGEARTLESVLIRHGDWQEGVKVWVEECALELHAPEPKPALAGYCSWYQRDSRVEPGDLLRAAREFAAFPTPPGGKTVQVDDGWQVKPGDWRPNAKFAAGWADLPRQIRSQGSLPGTYMLPTGIHETHSLVKDHPEWLQRLPGGEFAVHFSNWGGKTYFLELDRPEAKEFMTRAIEDRRKEGWDYLKIDFTYCFSTARVAFDRKKTSFETMRDLWALYRKAAGPKMLINACVGEAARYALGHVDITRLGGDMGSNWGTVQSTLKHVLMLAATNRVWWQADPDVYYMRQENSSLGPEESYLLTGSAGLLGGVFLTSDWPSQWTPEARAAVGEFWTAEGIRVPVDHRVVLSDDGVLRAFRATYDDQRGPRHSIGVYNWSDQPQDIRVPLREAGVDVATAWRLTTGAWSKGLRLEGGAVVFDAQPPHSLRIANLWVPG